MDSVGKPNGSGAADVSRWWPALAVAAVGIVASLAAFTVARSADDGRIKGILDLRVEWRARDFERKILLSAESVRALAVHAAADDNFDSVAFHRVARLGHDPAEAITALDWAPYVAGKDRDSFVAGAKKTGLPNYTLLERSPAADRFQKAAERNEYLPVLFEETFEGQPVPLGFDFLSQAGRRPTALRARDDGRPYATPIVRLFTVADSAAGYQVYWPVYAGTTVPRTKEQRRAAFRGMAVGRFRLDTVLAAAVRGTPPIVEYIDFFVDAGGRGMSPQHVAAYDPLTAKFSVGGPTATPMARDSLNRSFEILGRHWLLVSRFSPATIAELRSGDPWMLLGAGLLLTTLLATYVQRERTRRMNVEALVSARTSALTRANMELREETSQRRQTEESLRESKDLLQATFDAAPFPIVVLSPDSAILMWNAAAESTFGYRAAEVTGRSYAELVPEDGNALFDELFKRACSGERLTGSLVRRRHASGKLLDISFSCAPVFHSDGRLRAIVDVLDDVTQKLAVERQLLQAQKMEAIGNLTGGMAHDFNNLLGIIIGNLDLLSGQLEKEGERRELLADALDSAVRGSDLTRRLLAFARRQPLRPESTDVNALVSGITTLLRRTLGEDIQIDLKLASQLGRIRVDPAQLEAAILNLATNARDAMVHGGKLIVSTANVHLDEIYAAQHAEVQAGEYTRIEVCDTGNGIAADILPHIFDPFFTTKEAGKGSGLGLSMVYGFMKQSGGHINVYSEPDKGTCFRLYLPRALHGEAEVRPVVAQRAQGGNERVLVVEDNEKLRRVVVKQLSDLGYEVLQANGAAAALALLRSKPVDLLFTDIVMPGEINGAELAREARSSMPHLRTLFTSGFPGGRLDDGGWLTARDKLLSKPYRQDELARALREVLDQPVEETAGA
ncbi:MAG TPA: CHASE domain-containing protein [Rhizomicrobium sp.]|nr:CHASE domain-containing protein [Rhizomicrobium sp.]